MTQPIRADVLVRPDGKGHWRVELNNDALPRVLVNERYAALVSQKTKGEEKRYVNEQFQHANWLVKALDQRAKTILKVATEITKQQDLFLKYGIRYLKPLTLKIIADAIEMHESTVSRVTTQKYMQTPRGLLEMKYFFTSSLGYDTGMGELSSAAVKAQIQLLIEHETREHILSDDDIATTLKERGIDIARRTVAKYREALGFGSSTERRRQKKMEGN
jgi:RNA polymerase sigma-54 factor